MVSVPEQYRIISNKKITYEYKELFKNIKEIKDEFSGNSPPSIFVGSKLKYPKVNVGILSPPAIIENAWVFDNPDYWVENKYSIKEILNLRWSLINSRFRTEVKVSNNRFLDVAQEIGIASKPVDIEVKLKKSIKPDLNIDIIRMPIGQTGGLKYIKITENVKVSNFVDKVVSDTDLKANEALVYLKEKNFDENTLSKLLSIGVLGLGKNRKLVPSRWSITAVDDVLGKKILGEVRYYEKIENYRLFFGKYLGNYYLIMLMPYVFSYELFEVYLPRSAWNKTNEINVATDYEDYYGRKEYAYSTVGGYYASRLSLLQYLQKIKRQASVLVLRFETPEYWAGLGVWVVRSAARKTLEGNFVEFDSKEKMLDYARNLIIKNLRFAIEGMLRKSRMLNDLKTQRRLVEFN